MNIFFKVGRCLVIGFFFISEPMAFAKPLQELEQKIIRNSSINTQMETSRIPIHDNGPGRIIDAAGYLSDALSLLAGAPVMTNDILVSNAGTANVLANVLNLGVNYAPDEATLELALGSINKLIMVLYNQMSAAQADTTSFSADINVAVTLGLFSLRNAMVSEQATTDTTIKVIQKVNLLYGLLATLLEKSALDTSGAIGIANAVQVLEGFPLQNISVINSATLSVLMVALGNTVRCNNNVFTKLNTLGEPAAAGIEAVADTLWDSGYLVSFLASAANNSESTVGQCISSSIITSLATITSNLILASDNLASSSYADASALHANAQGINYFASTLGNLLTNTNATVDTIATCATAIESLGEAVNGMIGNSASANYDILAVLSAMSPQNLCNNAAAIDPLIGSYQSSITALSYVYSNLSVTNFFTDLYSIVQNCDGLAHSFVFGLSATNANYNSIYSMVGSASDTIVWVAGNYSIDMSITSIANAYAALTSALTQLGLERSIGNVQNVTSALSAYVYAILNSL